MEELLRSEIIPVNIGIKKFVTDLRDCDYKVIERDWLPPSGGDPGTAQNLADLADDDRGVGKLIKDANEQAVNRLISSRPVLRGLLPAKEVLKGMHDHTILHAGPPIEWEDMCGAMRGAIIGGILYERFASTPDEAIEKINLGEFEFAPCHSFGAVGPMAGIVTPRMPMMIIEDHANGTTGYASLNEGWGRTLRFGAFDQSVIERLDWMENNLSQHLTRSLETYEAGLEIKPIISKALHMGDECHNRDLAASSLFFKEIIPRMIKVAKDDLQLQKTIEFLSLHEHFFLNIAMAACKAALIAASDIPFSTMVTAMARNGVHVGIQTSGTGSKWFTAPGAIPQGLYFPGYSENDANPDLGDSAITETGGLGAFAMASAPAIVKFVGGSARDAIQYSLEMYNITLAEHPDYTMPTLNFRGTPTGIDAREVVRTSIAPVINTGIAHKSAGHGLVGAGVVRAPLKIFEAAISHIHSTYMSPNYRISNE